MGSAVHNIAAIETIRSSAHPNYLWVRIVTESGAVGVGETMPRVSASERVIHDTLAPFLLGRDSRRIEELWERMFATVAYHGYSGAELRALSAIDIALHDLLARAYGEPLYRLLGGGHRTVVPVYNTCVNGGDIRDHDAFRNDPRQFVDDMWADGVRAVKIYPFDELSVLTNGADIERGTLGAAMDRLGEFRAGAGANLEIAIEGHGLWSLPAALKIARALEPFEPMWVEDLIQPHDPDALRTLRRAARVPVCASERLFSRFQYASLLAAEGADVVMVDVCWAGGVTEARRIAAMASARLLPMTLHNCHGPVGAAATYHVAASLPTITRIESVRSFARTFFDEIAVGGPKPDGDMIQVADEPGLGVQLRDDFVQQANVERSVVGQQDTEQLWGSGDPWVAGDE